MPRPATITARTTFVGVSKLARKADLSQGYTSRLLKQGRSPQQIIERQRQRKKTRQQATKQQRKVAPSGQPHALETYASAQTRKEIAQANLRELEVLELRSKLIPIAPVMAWMGGCLIKARDLSNGLSDLADRIRQEPDVIAAEQLVDREVRRVLEELATFGELLAKTVVAQK